MTQEKLAQKNIEAQIKLLNKIVDAQACLIGGASYRADGVLKLIEYTQPDVAGNYLLSKEEFEHVRSALRILSSDWSKLGIAYAEYVSEIDYARETLKILT